MIKAMTRVPRLDFCTECNSERSIECFDTNDRPLNYSHLLDYMEQGKKIDLKDRMLMYMKCKKCGHVYCIDWQNSTSIPRPLYVYNSLMYFIDKNYNK